MALEKLPESEQAYFAGQFVIFRDMCRSLNAYKQLHPGIDSTVITLLDALSEELQLATIDQIADMPEYVFRWAIGSENDFRRGMADATSDIRDRLQG